MTDFNMRFDSLADVAQYLLDTPRNPRGGDSSTRRADDWHRYMEYSETLDICRNGGYWKPGADGIRSVAVPSDPARFEHSPARRPHRSVAGSRPHVPAAVAGSPKSMLRSSRKNRYRPAIRIGVDVTIHNSVTSAQCFNRGAAILSVIRQFENQGETVELYAYMYSRYLADNLLITLPIKSLEHRLSVNELSFLLTHPNVTRRLYMGLVERHPDFWRASCENYGKVTDLTPVRADNVFDVLLTCIKGHSSVYFNAADTAAEYILEEIRTQMDRSNAA